MGFNTRKDIVSLLLFSLVIVFSCAYSVSAASSPARPVNGFLSNVFSLLIKWVLSMKNTTKTALNRRPVMKFEGGYDVETVFDGSKLGIDPYSIQVLPDGDLLILDSANCNLYKISSSLSVYTRPRLISGSMDGFCGYVDGKSKDARMNHPKGLTIDDRGNVYVADTDNMVIRKISDTGVTTIAGGKQGRGGVHVDGPSEEAKFSNDFDVVYLGSTCSLLVIDRGNKAIREIQLPFDDCAYQYTTSIPFGTGVLVAAGFFGYIFALLQHRIASSRKEEEEAMKLWGSSMDPELASGYDQEKQEATLLGSIGKLATQTVEAAAEIIVPKLRNSKSRSNGYEYNYANPWPVQESFVIPAEDEPPSIEPRMPTPKKTYAFMTKDLEKMQQLRQSRALYSSWDDEFQMHRSTEKHQQHPRQYLTSQPHTYYEQNSEKSKEIVFGAVQDQEKQWAVLSKPLVDHGVLIDKPNLRSRLSHRRLG